MPIKTNTARIDRTIPAMDKPLPFSCVVTLTIPKTRAKIIKTANPTFVSLVQLSISNVLKIANILKINRDEINMELKKDDLPSWDSLAHIALVAELEEELNIEIPIEEVPYINCLNDFKKYFN